MYSAEISQVNIQYIFHLSSEHQAKHSVSKSVNLKLHIYQVDINRNQFK